MIDYYVIYKIGTDLIFLLFLLVLFVIYLKRKKKDNYSKTDIQASYMEGYEDGASSKRPKSFFESRTDC